MMMLRLNSTIKRLKEIFQSRNRGLVGGLRAVNSPCLVEHFYQYMYLTVYIFIILRTLLYMF